MKEKKYYVKKNTCGTSRNTAIKWPRKGNVYLQVSANCRLHVLKWRLLCDIYSRTVLSSLYLQDKKKYQITVTLFKKSCGHVNQIFKVLCCLETPVETLWAIQRMLNHLTHTRHILILTALLCPYRQARQSFFSRESLRTWLTLTRGRSKHNKSLCPWKHDLPHPLTHHAPDS